MWTRRMWALVATVMAIGLVAGAVMAADALMGRDASCMRWLRRFREAPPVGADGEAGRGRRESRRRRG